MTQQQADYESDAIDAARRDAHAHLTDALTSLRLAISSARELDEARLYDVDFVETDNGQTFADAVAQARVGLMAASAALPRPEALTAPPVRGSIGQGRRGGAAPGRRRTTVLRRTHSAPSTGGTAPRLSAMPARAPAFIAPVLPGGQAAGLFARCAAPLVPPLPRRTPNRTRATKKAIILIAISAYK